MSIKSEIEMACFSLVQELNQSEFDRTELRNYLKDLFESRYLRASVERDFNDMLQERQHAILLNKRGNVVVKKAPNTLERFFTFPIGKKAKKIIITRLEIDI